MGRIAICDDCNGAGVHGYERGPTIERCARCRGVGLTFADASTGSRDFLELLTASSGSELAQLGEGGPIRALALLNAQLEERCAELERALADRR